MKVLEIYGHVAMDIVLVGSWSSALIHYITAYPRAAGRGHVPWQESRPRLMTRGVRRKYAMLARWMTSTSTNSRFFAPASSLGAEDLWDQELYPMLLAVFPHGHAYGHSDTGVLLSHNEAVGCSRKGCIREV